MAWLRNLFVAHQSVDEICLFLRSLQGARRMVLPPPEADDPWVGIIPHQPRAERDPLAVTLSRKFKTCLEVYMEGVEEQSGPDEPSRACWGFFVHWSGSETFHYAVDSGDNASKEMARQRANAITDALKRPKLRTRLGRLFSKKEVGVRTSLEKFGEAIWLPQCHQRYEDLVNTASANTYVLVEGSKIMGKLASATAGPGYLHVSELIEDIVKPFLAAQNYSAALFQLRGYDIHLSRNGDAIFCRAPRGLVTQGLLREIEQHKSGLLPLLAESEA